MLEIIALIFISKANGDLATQKGIKPGTWKLYTVLAWIGAEILGFVIGTLASNMFITLILAYGFAFASYFIVRSILKNKPDLLDDDIDMIGKGY